MASIARPGGKRLPISCQACRTRKIRCSRDGRPCQTCVRRGLGAEDCIYLGQPRLSSEQTATADTMVHNELLARIRNLEEQLHKQVGSNSNSNSQGISSSAGSNSDPLSPQTTPSATGSASESDSAIGMEPRGPLLGNVGSLQTFTSGYVRYLPSASQWNSVVKSSTGSDCLQNIDAEIPDDDDDLQIPLVRNGSVSRGELLAILPPGRYCDTLKDVYFRVFSPLFHILHDLTFEAEYQQFCHDAGSVSLSWLALLFTILGIAVTALDDDDLLLSDLGREKTVSRNIKVLSSRYRSAAMRCLAADGVTSRHSINSLQTLVLICYARTHRGLPTWTLLGFSHHVAISMGCHIDPERFALGPIEREERRRAWAGLMMLYTIQNSSFGSLDQRLLAQDVKLPADINDVDLLTGSEPSTRPTQMTYLLLKFRLYKISAMICEAIFSFPYRPRLTVPQLESEILAVQERCDAQYQFDTSRGPLPTHHLANLNILYSYIHQLFLLLLRPSLCRYLQGEITPDTCAARAKCVASAKASLVIYQSLYESSQFAQYKWYNGGLGSFHAFHSAVVLSVVMMNPSSQSEFVEIKDILWNSLDVFAALSNRSAFCSKAVPILRQIIDVACSRQQQQQIFNAESVVTPPTTFMAPTPTHPSSPEYGTPIENFFPQLHPQNWVGPSSVPWDGFGILTMDQCGFGQVPG
ncbi:hypothetical protein AWENTII_006195 [Aspergillus wentii]